MSEVDVLVLGAGPAGTIAARELARAGKIVLLVGKKRVADAPPVGESLPGAAAALLRHLELLDVLERGPHAISYGNLSSWGSDDLLARDFLNDPNGPGWHLDRARFDADLTAEAESSGAERVTGTLADVDRGEDRWSVRLASDAGIRPIAARFLVDATGRRAVLGKRLGARRIEDAPLTAAYAWAPAGESDSDSRTLVEAVADGWWYTSLLPDHSRVVAFHTDAGSAAGITGTPEAWRERLSETKYVGKRIGKTGKIRFAAAGGGYLDPVGGSDWIATGDAALSFDPIASQGIFNAIYSGMKAGRAIVRALDGEISALEAYAERLDSIRRAYRRHVMSAYATELRWRDRPFWYRRAGSR